jgi:hypothetical protein
MAYTDQLSTWLRKNPTPKQDKNMVAFLAIRQDVQSAIDSGYALKTIWSHLNATGKIAYRYETFTRHVQRYIKSNRVKTSPDKMPNKLPTPPSKPVTPPAISHFVFRPTSTKEELI